MAPPHLLLALEHRVAGDGARPLVTWYGPDQARVELSAVTFANWVDKACNLLGSLGFDDEPVVGTPVVLSHPTHWQSWVWVFATWQTGGRVVCAPRDELALIDVAIVGPDEACPVPGTETIACSLHPLGLGFATPPPGVVDAREVLSEPDLHVSQPADPDEIWWSAGFEQRSGLELCAITPITGRVVVTRHDPVLAAVIGVVLGGGSIVLVDDDSADECRLATIAHTERATPFSGESP